MSTSTAGFTMAAAQTVGALSASVQEFSGFLGGSPTYIPYAYYQVTLNTTSVLNVTVVQDSPINFGSSVNADTSVAILDSAGTVVGYSYINPTTNIVSYSQPLHAGTYYIDVDNPGLTGSKYHVDLSAVPSGSAPMYFIDDSLEGQVVRLYQAAFGRLPDSAGLSYWAGSLHSGATLNDVANAFLGSAEFQGRYGTNPSATTFVTKLYNNVLHRDPDAAGLANWTGVLNSGASSQAQVLIGFSESAECKAETPPSALAQSAARLYLTVLNRVPDQAGLSAWTRMLSNGTTTLQQEATAFINSPEAAAVNALSDSAYVTRIYQDGLGRAPDSAGLADWTNQLAHGVSRASVVTAISESAECNKVHAYQVNSNFIAVA